MIALS